MHICTHIWIYTNICTCTHRSQSHQFLAPGHMRPWGHSCTPVAVHPHPLRIKSLTQENRNGVYYEDRTHCADQVQDMARQPYRLATHLHMTSPFNPLIPLFAQACSSQNHLDTSFPHLWFLPKFPVRSCLPKSPNAFPMHAMMCPISPGTNPLSPKGALALTRCAEFHTWTISGHGLAGLVALGWQLDFWWS